ncbi:unnamed protein product [Macrosiphum euphorbiae]|uniref:DDE Tnp4 domain-containing protein n=1 Tax=Macrosiphum euphorbiae TaxID=13131 RepID=A0AAV0WU31_9HEMI|nr:unnamed protein product [Macrosiphum euphorbiae]
MSSTIFEELVCLVGPHVTRFPSFRKDTLVVGEILSCTLRYLASGDILWQVLEKKVLLTPSVLNWKKTSREFEDKWNLPHCVAAIDGKHIVHQAFSNYGSTHFNYKGTHSTVLLAMCDANYNFLLVDIRAPGRCSDGGVFRSSNIGKAFANKTINLPEPIEIDGVNGPIPYFMVGDGAFPLTEYLMRPYPGRGRSTMPKDEDIFNYRLSRARRTIENAFGILASRFRIFRKPIIASEKTIINITKATIVLHNFIKKVRNRLSMYNQTISCSASNMQTDELQGLVPINRAGSNHYSSNAKEKRDKLKIYVNHAGALEYQQRQL